MTQANHLAHETSPYLLQHAHNPVDWYPWGDEALAKAKREDKPIFLSIGYAACHWCHVMEHESFENLEVAEYLNQHYVSIKVDREERPDLDEIYMTAVQMLTGSGGWPMTVFLTPDLKPFYGGTYFPPEDRWGRPGFLSLIKQIHGVWQDRRADVDKSADQITAAIRGQLGSATEASPLNERLLEDAVGQLRRTFDTDHGGFGDAPKFPSAQSISILLRHNQRHGDKRALEMATKTLDEMAFGGMYDQLGGGFHRYSVDDEWLVPHFEKMLYDNAQLAQAYLEAYQVTGNPEYRRIVDEVLTYVLDRMTDARGGFYSTEDADSEGEEGKYYLWTKQEILDILGPDDGAFICQVFQIQDDGNFSSHEQYHAGLNIPHWHGTPAEEAARLKLDRNQLWQRLEPLKQKLLAVRAKRVPPGLDDKELVAWNGLMISAFARAGRVLDTPRYTEAAQHATDFILTDMRRPDGGLYHTWRKGEARVPAFLDDYACLINALVDLYEATYDPERLQQADDLTKQMIATFGSEDAGSFYATGDQHTHLIARPKSSYDSATPSGNSMAALALQRLAIHLNEPALADRADAILRHHVKQMQQAPRGFGQMLLAVDFRLFPSREIAIVGAPADPGTQALLAAVNGKFLPNCVLALLDPAHLPAKMLPLLDGKTLVDGHPAAYVCRDYACQRPVTTPDALLKLLDTP